MGTTSSGKSTIVNLLAGREIVPIGVQETTTIETRVVHRFECDTPVVTYDRVAHRVAPGGSPAELVRHAFRATSEVVTVDAALDSTNWLGFSPVQRWALVDLPGVRAAPRPLRAGPGAPGIPTADLVVCVFNAEETDEGKERLVVRSLAHLPVGIPVLFVLNRADAFERDVEPSRARTEALARRARMIAEVADADRSTPVVPLVARAAFASLASEPVTASARPHSRQALAEHASLLAPLVLQGLPRDVARWSDVAAREVAAAVLKHSGANEFLGRLRILVRERISGLIRATDQGLSEPAPPPTSSP